jgi:hypothetical protein
MIPQNERSVMQVRNRCDKAKPESDAPVAQVALDR